VLSDARRADARRAGARSALSDARELLQAANLARGLFVLATLRPGNLRDVDVAARVGDHAMRSDELARCLARELTPEARDLLSLGVQHRDARAEIGHGFVDRQGMPELAHVESAAVLCAINEEPAGSVEIIPLSLVLTPAVEDLDAMVLAIGHIHDTFRVRY